MKLAQTNPNTWHRLKQHPDRIDKAGPTAFEVTHHVDTVTGRCEVHTRDGPGKPSFRVSGSHRVDQYLATEIVEPPLTRAEREAIAREEANAERRPSNPDGERLVDLL